MRKLDWCKPIGGITYITTKPVEWHIGKKNSGHIETIPAGFPFESSVPRLKYKWKWLNKLLGWFQPFEWFLSPHDPLYLLAACVHDWFLEGGYKPAFAAGEWYDAAMAYHAPKLKTKLAFFGIFKHTVR